MQKKKMMRKTLVALMVPAVWALQWSCRNKPGHEMERHAVPGDCLKLASRHKRCLDALAVVARERGTELLLRSMTNLSPEERARLRNQVQAHLKRNQDDFRKILVESFDKEFPSWCAGAVSSSRSREQVRAMRSCLSRPDCQTYAACIGNVLETMSTRTAQRSSPARPVPAAASVDATNIRSPEGSRSNIQGQQGAGSRRARPSDAVGKRPALQILKRDRGRRKPTHPLSRAGRSRPEPGK